MAMQPEFAYDSFTRVGPRKKRKGRDKERNSATPFDLLTRAREELTTDGRWIIDCKEVIQNVFRDTPIKPRKVLCLGLGSPSFSRDARAQLAFLVHLSACSGIEMGDVFAYDPVFSDGDGQLLQTLGTQPLDDVQASAEYSVNCPTILYMPHCEMALYEKVIRANWTPEGLCSVVFIANRFSDYVDNNGTSKLEKECPYLLRLVPLLECRTLPASRAYPNAFNSLSIQYVTGTLSSPWLL